MISAVIVATPVYKAAYSGLLKAFLDLLPQDSLKGKVVLPVATSAIPGHGLALDCALKPVLSALGARHVLDGIYALDQQVFWSPQTGLRLDPGLASRIDERLARLVDTTRPPGSRPSLTADSFFPCYDRDPELVRCWD